MDKKYPFFTTVGRGWAQVLQITLRVKLCPKVSYQNSYCHRLWLVFVATALLPMRFCAYGQDKQAKLIIEETSLDTPIGISVEDLQLGLKALNDLREEREQFCQNDKNEKSQTPEVIVGESCKWHQVVPQVLRKERPLQGYHEIVEVFESPYSPYDLHRSQNGLDLLSFVPVKSAKDGFETFKRWTSLAETGELFDCRDPSEILNHPGDRVPDNYASDKRIGLRLVSTHPSNRGRYNSSSRACLGVVRNTSKQPLDFLSVCEVLNINGVSGVPERCFPIAATSSKAGDWILATTAFYYILLAENGTPDFTVNLFRYQGSPQAGLEAGAFLHTEDVLKAAEIAMSGPPLLLTTRLKSDVLGVSPRRNSNVLGRPWNEQVTVRVDVSDIPTERDGMVIGHNFSLEVSTSILVNEQKDPHAIHWHEPSKAQTQTWNDAIRQRLNQEISRLCPHPERKDDFTVVCQKP